MTPEGARTATAEFRRSETEGTPQEVKQAGPPDSLEEVDPREQNTVGPPSSLSSPRGRRMRQSEHAERTRLPLGRFDRLIKMRATHGSRIHAICEPVVGYSVTTVVVSIRLGDIGCCEAENELATRTIRVGNHLDITIPTIR